MSGEMTVFEPSKNALRGKSRLLRSVTANAGGLREMRNRCRERIVGRRGFGGPQVVPFKLRYEPQIANAVIVA
jgi:hypothetical protein